MNIKKLLATTAIAAMVASSASALDVQYGNSDGAVAIGGVFNAVQAQLKLANELDLANTPQNGTFEFIVTTSSAIPAADNIKLTVQLPAGVTFNGNVAATAINDGAAVAVLSALVSQGGLSGSDKVTFLIDTDTAEQSIGLSLNLSLSGASCSALEAPISIGLSTENNTPIENGGSSNSTPINLSDGAGNDVNLVSCGDALSFPVSDDFPNGAANDSVVTLASSFTDFNAAVAGDLAATATLGTMNGAIDVTANLSLVNTGGADPMVFGDISNLAFSVNFVDASAFTGVTVGGIGNTGTTGNNFDFSLAAPVIGWFDGGADDIIVTNDTTTAIASQATSTSSITATFGGAGLVGSKIFAGAALDSLQREGAVFGPFNWVGGATSTSRNIFRFTGFPGTTTSVDGEVEVRNSSTGVAVGPYSFTLNLVNGEGQISNNVDSATNSSFITAVGSDFGRADITVRLFDGTSGLNVDRLILRNNVLSAFGGPANGANGSDGTPLSGAYGPDNQ